MISVLVCISFGLGRKGVFELEDFFIMSYLMAIPVRVIAMKCAPASPMLG